MNFKACTFTRLALSFFWGLLEALKSRKLPPFGSEFIRRKRRRWAYHFLFWYASGPGIPPIPLILEEDVAFVLTMRSQDSETITFQAAVRCCVTATLASETF